MAFFSSISKERQERLVAFIGATLEQQVKDLQALIRIPSVKAAPEGNLPFGAPMQEALDATLKLGESLGFPGGRDLEGYAGIIETGSGEEMLGILAHLDVVPAGEGWSCPPFGAEVRDGRIYGRGAIDDKGPAVSALYALAAIQDAGIPLNKRVRVILGCDEESGWACMDRYKKTEELPTMAFSPDGEYPLVYSEKAIMQATFKKRLTHRTAISISAGERANVVPGTAEAVVPKSAGIPGLLAEDGFSLAATDVPEGTRLTVTGLGAHASTPENGRNALLYLLRVLHALPLPEEDAALIALIADTLKMDTHGETLGLDTTDDSGRLTLNVGVCKWNGEEIALPPQPARGAGACPVGRSVCACGIYAGRRKNPARLACATGKRTCTEADGRLPRADRGHHARAARHRRRHLRARHAQRRRFWLRVAGRPHGGAHAG